MPPTVEGIGLLFLLPFCSHNTPKQGGTRRRTTHHQTTWNRLLSNAFPARSEGYRAWPCCTHNPKVVGSNPTPATNRSKELDRGWLRPPPSTLRELSESRSSGAVLGHQGASRRQRVHVQDHLLRRDAKVILTDNVVAVEHAA